MFSDNHWKVLIDAIQTATESGDLEWQLVGDEPLELQEKQTAIRFEATFDTNARIELFGRFRGFSYSLEIDREGPGGYEFEDSITVKSKENSREIPFDVLFRTVRAQVRESRKRTMEANRDRWFAWAINCLELLPSQEHDAWAWEPHSQDQEMADLNDDQWESLVTTVTACTESKTLKWTLDQQPDPGSPPGGAYFYSANIDDDFSLLFTKSGPDVLAGPDKVFDLNIDGPQDMTAPDDFGNLRGYPGGQLERLAELIGASNRREFQEILADEALQGFLRGLGKN